KKKRKKTSLKYPKFSLLKSLEIAKSIMDNNAGKPYDRLSLAKSLGQSPGSSKYRMQITSSGKFGLTKGGYNAPKISLTPLAISILRPKSEEEKENGLKEALFNIDFYKKIFNKYNKSKVPNKQLFKNTLLREFDIPQDVTEQCYKLIMENAKELNILQEISGSSWVNLDKFGDKGTIEEGIHEAIGVSIEKVESKEKEIKKIITKDELLKELKPNVFISHSKNMKILEQIKQILDFGQYDYLIAEEEETTAIPIPEKSLD
ncbi:unnamed protein product, partial [marine sediment metagenome]